MGFDQRAFFGGQRFASAGSFTNWSNDSDRSSVIVASAIFIGAQIDCSIQWRVRIARFRPISGFNSSVDRAGLSGFWRGSGQSGELLPFCEERSHHAS